MQPLTDDVDKIVRLQRQLDDAPPPEEKQPTWPGALDLVSLLSTSPAPPEMLVDDWLPAGYASLLAGHGGGGKSTIALHLAVCASLGRTWWGRPVKQRRTLYLSCEDRASILHWRLQRICERERIPHEELVDRLYLRDLVGQDAVLFRTHFGLPILTAAYDELARIVEYEGPELLVIDGVSDTYGGNENDRGEVKQYVNSLVKLMGEHGAVLLLHHVNKLSASNGATSEGYSGSTGWHNSVRARWYLKPETERVDDGAARSTGALLLELQKSNFGMADQSIKLTWDRDEGMFIADNVQETPIDPALQDTDERAGIVRAFRAIKLRGDYVPAAAQGQRTALHVLMAEIDFPPTLKIASGKRRFWRHIEHLRRIGTLRESSIKRKDRHFIATLELGSGLE